MAVTAEFVFGLLNLHPLTKRNSVFPDENVTTREGWQTEGVSLKEEKAGEEVGRKQQNPVAYTTLLVAYF